MAAKHDLQHGITADLAAPRDDIAAACRRASETFGEWARFSDTGNKLTVTLLTRSLGGRLMGSKKGRPTIIGIPLEDNDGGRIHLDSTVEKYSTVQSTVFGFIPAGPKRLWGRERYFKFLNPLENELRALDPSGNIVRRTDKG